MATKRQATLDLFTVFREETDAAEINETSTSSNGENYVSLESNEETVSHVGLGQLAITNGEKSVEMYGPTTSNSSSLCSAQCCVDESNVFQPKDNHTIKSLKTSGPAGKTRNFQLSWYSQFPWISVCVNRKRVLCLYCQYAEKHHWFKFSRCGEKVFTEVGFNNWKKAIEKFKSHENSHFHKEAQLKWVAQERPTIGTQLSVQMKNIQQKRRAGFLKQLRAIQYLTQQGIALQGHTKIEGNLQQLMLAWSHDSDVIKTWISENHYTCHQTLNELIELMGQTLLRSLLLKIKKEGPPW